MLPIYIIYETDIYEVSNYINQHPGEGINNSYIARFHRKNCTDLFNRYHMTDEPFHILAQAKEHGEYKTIKYICKNPFKRRIAKCFTHIENSEPLQIIPYENQFIIKYKIENESYQDIIIIQNNTYRLSQENQIYNSIEQIINKIKSMM